ncbi:FeoA family protein [Aureispira anguillae]|uniref:Ferrous iron transport protein A n=1 Tax=Aureispira anguillae TaxID=2864201 RepID=A0A915YHN4_9BACT|nr:FeoA family protein [Aureispira anguillae]BDS13370.1 ferrous iron transport protein A [Aureispira anguillae]
MVLTDLKTGEKAIIQSFGNPKVELIMTDMGCPLGTTIEIYHKTISNGPISIKTSSGNLLAIRSEEAKHLTICKQ